MNAKYFQYILHFKQPSGTSRGILHTKETFILEIEENGRKGIGECAIFRGLSSDDVPEYEEKLKWLCDNVNENPDVLQENLRAFPSIWIGYEQAILNLKNGADLYFITDFTSKKASIKTNGLIWMGNVSFMNQQIEEKIQQNFSCIKLKIGVNWEAEYKILKELRKNFPAELLELRVDANGAFSFNQAKNVLNALNDLEIHSIEQPIKHNQPDEMRLLCQQTRVPIALDEELIGINHFHQKQKLLEHIQPQYIILKPSLVGGFSGCDEWIEIADNLNIGWWITSALESNIGLNAIAQYTYTKGNSMPQGLGTGSLFTNNFESRLILKGERLFKK